MRAEPLARPDLVVAVGKAAAAMTRAARQELGEPPALVITKHGHLEGLATGQGLVALEAAHPVPDAASLEAGRLLLERLAALGKNASVLLLVSGGASSLVEVPQPGLDLDALAARNAALLASGKTIGEMNAERRQWSRIKGGGLLAAFRGAHAEVLAISDVEGDDIGTIGSGIGAPPPDGALDYRCRIIASNSVMRAAAAAEAERQGLPIVVNEESLYENVTALAPRLGRELREGAPGLRIYGGEPTVVLPEHPGEGGRNQALALELAREIAGAENLRALVAGSDGTDGPTEAAGGLVDGGTWTGPGAEALARADSGGFLRSRGALFETGPTGTNVMDLALCLKR